MKQRRLIQRRNPTPIDLTFAENVLQIKLHTSKIACPEVFLNLERIGYDTALVHEPSIPSGNMVTE